MNRLKFVLKTRPPVVERPNKEPCGICKRQTSRYTCPTCNVPFCSLTCFRAEVHSECSESFYRKEIEKDIHASAVKSPEERRKMLELLRRFEAESTQATEASHDDDDDFAQRLEGISLDEADPETLWSILSPAQQDSFLRVMRNPSGELAQQLLASAEIQLGRRKPWWESPRLDGEEEEESSSDASGEFGLPPKMMSIPPHLRFPDNARDSTRFLAYNILALCLVYAYVTRRLSISPLSSMGSSDPDHAVALDLLSRIAPFLTERGSTLVFSAVDGFVTDIWSRLEALSDPPSTESFATLLADAAFLFRPKRISVITEDDNDGSASTLSSHPSRSTLLVISDIASLFARGSAKPSRHVSHKLDFYASYLCAQDPHALRLISEEARIAGLRMSQPP